jgi:hypothetical protein
VIKSFSLRIAFVLGAILPIFYALHVMHTHWVAVPWWDEWLTPGTTLASFYQGTLRFADLWAQHNESRKLFPRLLYLALYLPGGWDVRYGMALTFAWVCVGSAGLYWLLRQTVSAGMACFGFLFMNLLLFSPREYENLLYAIEGENFTPAIALVFALLCNLRAKSFRTKTLVSGLLALISTYTFANGMLLWALAFPVHWKNGPQFESVDQRKHWRIAYIFAAALTVGTYFIGYRPPAESPPIVLSLYKLPQLAHYFATWLGNLFLTPFPAFAGILTLILFITLALYVIRKVQIDDSIRIYYPWLSLGSYVLISGLVTASGRVGFGVGAALDVRYTAFTVFFYIAIIGLLCILIDKAENVTLLKLTGISGALALITAWFVTLRQEMPHISKLTGDRMHLRLVTRWSLALPANPDLSLLSPYPNTLQTLRVLAKHNALWPRLIGPVETRAVQLAPQAGLRPAGYLDQVSFVGRNQLRFRGWAQLPNRKVPADCVVIGYWNDSGKWSPFAVTETGLFRPDVAALLRNPRLASTGFDHTLTVKNFSHQAIRFGGLAVDMQHKRTFRLLASPVATQPAR